METRTGISFRKSVLKIRIRITNFVYLIPEILQPKK